MATYIEKFFDIIYPLLRGKVFFRTLGRSVTAVQTLPGISPRDFQFFLIYMNLVLCNATAKEETQVLFLVKAQRSGG